MMGLTHTLRIILVVGAFSWAQPSHSGQQQLSLTPEALHLIFDGVDLRDGTLCPWYEQKKGSSGVLVGGSGSQRQASAEK